MVNFVFLGKWTAYQQNARKKIFICNVNKLQAFIRAGLLCRQYIWIYVTLII